MPLELLQFECHSRNINYNPGLMHTLTPILIET
jgi:hypothetical protein